MTEEPPRKRMVKRPTGGQEGGRGKPARLKTAKQRTPSQQAWLERQVNDPFSAKARALGYRSRAVFKISEIDERFHFLRPGARVVDLGLAPGGWTQFAIERGVTNIVGVDLLPVDPLPPAVILQMDFTDPACGPKLIELLGGAPDVVLSDMAPNTIGHRETDHQGGGTDRLIAGLKRHFAEVKNVKPKASRQDSSEVFLVATGFKGR